MPLSPNSRLGPYEIKSALGVGGMGEVYRAHDSRLNRDVAIKVLRSDSTATPELKSRFEREARAVAALNHPNIVSVFDFGIEADSQYIVSELIDGESLRLVIAGKPVPARKLIDIAVQVADGLAAAHAAGIVHRDLKPENILVTKDGRAKILDFGLARQTTKTFPANSSDETFAPETKDNLTNAGTILGTPSYMSPEQAVGKETDYRSDQFSFGLILHEMATGKQTFARSSSVETLAAIVRDEPPPIEEKLPTPLKWIIDRCLHKEPEQRYESTRDLYHELRNVREHLSEAQVAKSVAATKRWIWRPVYVGLAVLAALLAALNVGKVRSRIFPDSPSTEIRSLAVLPLENMSKDPDQDYFSEGMTDALTTELAQIGSLRVISRTSAANFKGTQDTLPEIGRKLNVDAIVEGSVTRSENRVRITAQLIDAQADRHLWARTYERDWKDILQMQDDVARDIAEEIRVNLTPAERARLADARAVVPAAHDAYLRGRYFWALRTEADLHKAKDYFEQAIALDPGYAAAYSGLADTYFYLSYYWGHIPPREGMPLAKAAALKAVELDDSAAEGHASLATVKFFYDWDFPGAEEQVKRAIALNPNYEWGHHLYSVILAANGRSEESVAEARKAVEVDPLSVPANNILGDMLTKANRCDDAIAVSKKTLDLDPNQPHLAMVHKTMADCYELKGMAKESLEEEVETRTNEGASAQDIKEIRETYALHGRKGLLRKDLQAALASWDKDHWHVDATTIAGLYADLGDMDNAFAWIDKCIEIRSTMLIWIYTGDNPLQHDPRFAEVRRKMGVQVQGR